MALFSPYFQIQGGYSCLRPIPPFIAPSSDKAKTPYTILIMHHQIPFPSPSNFFIMKHEVDIPRPLRIIPDEILIALRPLLLRVTCQHTLQANTHAFDVVDRGPAGAVEQVEADDAVGVDVRVPGYRVGFVAEEDYFGGLRGRGLAIDLRRRWGGWSCWGEILQWDTAG